MSSGIFCSHLAWGLQAWKSLDSPGRSRFLTEKLNLLIGPSWNASDFSDMLFPFFGEKSKFTEKNKIQGLPGLWGDGRGLSSSGRPGRL